MKVDLVCATPTLKVLCNTPLATCKVLSLNWGSKMLVEVLEVIIVTSCHA